MKLTESIIAILAGLAALLTLVGTVIYFYVKLDGRVEQLEAQVHTLTVAPAIATAVTTKDGSSIQPVANPVAQTCADLARRAADEIGRGSVLPAEQFQRMMANLQCTQIPKN